MNYISQLSQGAQMAERLSIDNIRSEFTNFQSRLSTLRPPQEFLNIKKISKPQNFGEVQSRVSYNLRHFSTNYIAIILVLFIYTLLTNLLLSFVLLVAVVGVMGINRLQGADLNTPFGPITTSQLYTGLLFITIPLGFFASPISTLMWLIGLSAVIVFSHASFMEKPIESVFEEETV
ncbi:HEL208Cp [Eremothecium sinecaudum]|uniref:PRA1 family protein n=1 Tax=Eremothecium sinecaudum TaxID=45286 RepID=A0A109UZG6_9SACH|nr:HEL208Cp [Eremothecium sinecaudum]AMD21073.1 HEL208Cp [Eremothecium sinecaudum]